MSYLSIKELSIYKGYLVKIVYINVHFNIKIYIQQKMKSHIYNIKFTCTNSSYAKSL